MGKGVIYRVPSRELAQSVVNRYVENASPEWANRYMAGVEEYVMDSSKQAEAIAKLSDWYDILRTVAPEVARAYAKAKEMYKNRRAGKPISVQTPLARPVL